jgi:hypothetical protein
VANELTKRGPFVSPTGVRRVWLGHPQPTQALEAKADLELMILTEEKLGLGIRCRA